MAAVAILVTLSGFAAIWAQAAWLFVLGVTAAIAYYFWCQHAARLSVVTEKELKVAKRSALLGLLMAAFPAWFG